jgi:mevalonate kinase
MRTFLIFIIPKMEVDLSHPAIKQEPSVSRRSININAFTRQLSGVQRFCMSNLKLSQNPFLEPLIEAEGSAPAKLILSGEHAVLYGAPALAAALGCRLIITVKPLNASGLQLRCPVMGLDLLYTPQSVFEIARAAFHRYDLFAQEQLPIVSVLEQPYDLLICALAYWLTEHERDLEEGLVISVVSAIPMGYGLGSSAAGIVSLFRALEQYDALYDAPNIFFERAVTIEHLQHGVSSGIDVAVCQTEAPCLYRQKCLTGVFIPEFKNAWLVNTGMPQVSTGTCVASVRPHFENAMQVREFEETTLCLMEACVAQDERKILAGIARNHALLCGIGTVPQRVQAFMRKIEASGGAGKLCGAGATLGEGGGMAWVMGQSERLLPVFEEWGYPYEPLRFAHHLATRDA